MTDVVDFGVDLSRMANCCCAAISLVIRGKGDGEVKNFKICYYTEQCDWHMRNAINL